uniref:snRNA-activating protein complex subunit 4 n=1 Tax=Calidris pygmaea TaxID=425635 RepID=A0A8C3JX22_9CHAR
MSRWPGPAGARRPPAAGAALSPAALDLNAEREKIRREIEELERSLEPGGAGMEAADSSLSSGTDFSLFFPLKCLICTKEMEREDDSSDDDIEGSLPQDPETCLQMNHVYQEVIQEKIDEVELLIAQNKEQQKEIMCELDGSKIAKGGDGRNLPANIFLGHFMKPYFKDKTTGIGPPSNEDAKEKAAQGIKSFEQLISTKWKSREKTLLQKSVVSDSLQRLLQPKLLKINYWNQKLEKVKTEMEKQILEKQIKEVEQEIEAINQLPESDLLGNRFDEHDWEKISNIHFDGQRSSGELKKFWQNWEHPSINKKEWTEEEIERLKKIAAKHGYLDWQAIAQELGTNRTPFQCLQKYQVYNKDLKRKEWTKSEDQMLLELVQEMRVGSHIPYKKIAYYMEGRDSAQLIYRWTKSVDPSLKKGPWTPEEDAALLAAVKKYGERDWYKIRTEVPGRSDAQCRDRYLKALHCDVKKGKWSLEEEEQLIELVEKHGLGHWSKIASELPHRTGSQCLSKWKLMIGSKQKRSRPTKRRHVEESSSSSESSSEDTELDLPDSSEEEMTSEEETTSKEECAFPSIDLWIPTWTNTQESNQGRYQTPSLFSPASADAKTSGSEIPSTTWDGDKDRVDGTSTELNTLLRGITRPHSTDIIVKNPVEVMNKQSKILKPSAAVLTKISGVSTSGQKLQGLQNITEKTYRQERERLRRMNLDRKLLMAVTPWVGNVLLPCTLQTGKMAFRQTKGTDFPILIFSFYSPFSIGNSSQACTQRKSQRGVPRSAVRRPVALKAWETSAAALESSTPAIQAALPAQGQRQKPKTVSELLREKRLRESRAKKAMQRTVFVAPQMLVSGPLIIQHPPQQIIPSVQAASKPAAVGCTNSPVQCTPAPFPGSSQGIELQSSKERKEQALESSPEGGAFPAPNPAAAEKAPNQGGCNGQVLAGSSASVVLQNQAFVPRQITVVPVGIDSGTTNLSLSTPVTCELNSKGPQQGPVNLLPALVTPQAGSCLIPNSILPFTWVVTPQALLPTTVQTVVGVPQGLPAAAVRNQCQTTVTSNGNVSSLAVPPAPAGASAPQPSGAETKAPSAHLAEPSGKTTNHSTTLLPMTSASPGSTTSSISSAAPCFAALKNRPIASKPPTTQPAESPPQPTTSSAEKNPLDFSLISLEDEGVVKEWLSGKQGVLVPSLQTRLPYLPPFLCNVKTLSKLLLQKAALEEQAACLLPSDASRGEGTGVDLHAIGELVQQKLGDNPAYLLLKARFLAAFTLPAVLATLPPPKVATTLSASRKQYEESDEEEWQSEKEEPEEESCGNEFAGVRLDGTVGIAAQSVLDSCTAVADASAPQIRRSTRFRKRKRV